MSNNYFDYHTAPVNLITGDVIDTSTTGVSFYNQFLSKTDAEYLKQENNLVGKIVYMTPQRYYELCGQYGFPGGAISPDSLKQQRSRDVKILNHLKNVLTDYGHKFPLPYISIAERGQEGLHRMMVIGDMFGWNSGKYPVLVVEFADLQRAEQEKQQSIINKYSSYIRYAIRQTLQYKFNDLEELKEQLQFDLDREFQYVDEVDKPVKFELFEDPSDPDYYIVKVGKASADIEKASIKFIEIEDSIDVDDIELDDLEETEDFLKRYFGDNWRETDPHLKDVFGIKESVTSANDIIKSCAKITRDYIVQKYGTETDLCGKCIEASDYLLHLLKEAEISAKTVEGYIVYDIDENCSDRAWDEHTWVELDDGTVVDVTVEQFNYMMYEDYPPILIEKDPHGYVYERPSFNWLDELDESIEYSNIKEMDDAIQSNFGADVPGDGCIFIAPNGKFINIYPELDDHEDLCYWLEEIGFDSNPKDAEWFVDTFNYVRCRCSPHLCFIELPSNITKDQYYSLEDWLEEKVTFNPDSYVKPNSIDIEAPNGEWNKYNLDEYFPKDIIKLIKRFYSSGKLYEQK